LGGIAKELPESISGGRTCRASLDRQLLNNHGGELHSRVVREGVPEGVWDEEAKRRGKGMTAKKGPHSVRRVYARGKKVTIRRRRSRGHR